MASEVHFEAAPDVDEIVGSASREGIPRAEEVVVEVDVIPLELGRRVLVVESELNYLVADGIGSHAS